MTFENAPQANVLIFKSDRDDARVGKFISSWFHLPFEPKGKINAGCIREDTS